MDEIKTIDITTLTWFDKINGNTYFAQEIIINFGLDSRKTYYNPFQYGYSSFDIYAIQFLHKEGVISTDSLYELELDKKVVVRHNIYKNCKKRELTNLSK